MTELLALVIGLFVGWNFPQPAFAKVAQAWIMTKIGRTKDGE